MEDDEKTARLVRDLLMREGFRVETAGEFHPHDRPFPISYLLSPLTDYFVRAFRET